VDVSLIAAGAVGSCGSTAACSARASLASAAVVDAGAPSRRIYTLTVFGAEPNRILDVDDLALDGDGDGSPGGNFTSTFTVIHVIG
jgi:hypothetical protein